MAVPSRGYARYVLGLLTFIYTLSYVDQGLMMVLLQPIEADLHLTDTELGFLTGIVFGLFYATVGVPVARWSDRWNRAHITGWAVLIWGVTVMSCAAVVNFPQLAAARMAAAIGEVACMPPTYSLIADYFPGARERIRAMTVYMLAPSLALMVSFVVGGWVNERYGWHLAFLIMGIPGLIAAVLAKLTLIEPIRAPGSGYTTDAEVPRTSAVLLQLWRQPTSRHLMLGLILLLTLGAGLGPWYAAFLIRTHGIGTTELGLWLGLIFGIGGVAGTSLGGYVATHWFANDERAQTRLGAVMTGVLVPSFALFLFVPGKWQALIAFIPLVILLNFFVGPLFALMQRLVPDRVRATAIALVMLLANLIGMGIGPQVVGILSDALRPLAGTDSLRYSMLLVSSLSIGSAWHFWCAGRTVARDLQSSLSNSNNTTSELVRTGLQAPQR